MRSESCTHFNADSLTLALGLAKSSLRRELCSVNLLNFNSAIDWLCGREAIILVVCRCVGGNGDYGR